MKKVLFFVVFLCAALNGFAQRLSSVGIMPVTAAEGLSGDTSGMTQRIIAELGSWGTLRILPEGEAGNAEYLVQSSLSRRGGQFILSASTIEAGTGKVLNEFQEEASSIDAISIAGFCVKAVEHVPYPNYLLGKWRSVIVMADGPVSCVLEFRQDRTVRVEQYDTWEHRENNALKYEGYGSGSYTYAGYIRRTMTVKDARGNQRQIEVDATLGVNLKLEETLPDQSAVNLRGLRVLFNADKSAFEFVTYGLPCGNNYDGAAVYPSRAVAFTGFTKIE